MKVPPWLLKVRYWVSDQHKAIQKGVELLKKHDLQQEMAKNRARFLEKKIDVTGFLVWYIENWPESFKIMKKDPDYQYRFSEG